MGPSADHDGDMLGTNVLMSDEANAEIKDFLEKPASLVDSSHHLTYGLGVGRICKLTLFASTYHALPEQKAK